MRGFVSFIAVLAFAGPALAGSAVSLKADAASADSVVTLGDLFDGAGPAGRVAVATRTGASVVLDAAVVQAAARRAGLDWANAEGLHRIIVRGGSPETALAAPSAGVAAAAAAATHGNVEVLT